MEPQETVPELTIADCRPEVVKFAVLMEQQLRKHDDTRGPAGWKTDKPMRLFEHLEEEVGELYDAVQDVPLDKEKIAKEGADAGNMVMMVVDACGGLP